MMLRDVVLTLIECYQRWVSPFIGVRCRFVPSCSQYAWLAVAKYGVLRGGWLTIRRLSRCHPWYNGSWQDPLP